MKNEENWTKEVTVYVCEAKIEPTADGLPLMSQDVKRGVGAACVFHTFDEREMLGHMVEMHPQQLLASFASIKKFEV